MQKNSSANYPLLLSEFVAISLPVLAYLLPLTIELSICHSQISSLFKIFISQTKLCRLADDLSHPHSGVSFPRVGTPPQVITIESHGTFSNARVVNSCSAIFSCGAAVATGLTASVDPRCQTQLWRALIKINLHHPKSSPIAGTTVGPHHSVIVSSRVPLPRG
jgi:hypothetical protein